MSKIKNAFLNRKAFIAFLTGGDPSPEKSVEFIEEMINAGADLIEIGIPFSDPVAEGPVIQEANIRALSAGTKLDDIFGIVEQVRKTHVTPVVFLTYLNPVFHYGYEAFFTRCEQTGVDGIIIPDMPFEEQDELKETARKHGIDLVSLIAPTSEGRIAEIAQKASGYIYVVSSMGVTGTRSEITTDIGSMVKVIREKTDVPIAVGFGINTPQQAREISSVCDGVIVGSAIVKIIGKYGINAGQHIFDYVKEMKSAIILT
jgi:tryptophan synthase alpha chain